MANIEVFSSQNGQNIQNNVVALNQNLIVRINVDIGDVENIVRRGQAAVITLKNGEVIVVENYFDFALEKNRVEFQSDGKLYWAEFTDSDGNLLNTIKFYPMGEEVSREGGSIILPWLIGIAGVGGIIAAANSDNGHSGGGSSSGGGALDDMVSPKLLGSTVDPAGDKITLTFNEQLDQSSVPTKSTLEVKVDGVTLNENQYTVTVEGDKIVINPVDIIYKDQIVEVIYKDQAGDQTSGVIQDKSGNDVDSFDDSVRNGSLVENNDVIAPIFVDVYVNAVGAIVLDYDSTLDGMNLPPQSSFTVTIEGAAVTVNAVYRDPTDPSRLIVVTDPVVKLGQQVTIGYKDPTTNNDSNAIQDLAGNDAADLAPVTIPLDKNNSEVLPEDVDNIAPVYVIAFINAAGAIVLDYDSTLDGVNLPPQSSFTVTIDGVAVTVNTVSRDPTDPSRLILVTDPVVKVGQVVTVGYKDPTTNNDSNAIQDLAGNDAVDLAPVTIPLENNNSENLFEDNIPPKFLFGEITSSGLLELNFSESLSTQNRPEVSQFKIWVDGVLVTPALITVVENKIIIVTSPLLNVGSVVRVEYQDLTPSNDVNAIQDLAGNDSVSFNTVIARNKLDEQFLLDSSLKPIVFGGTIQGVTALTSFNQSNLPNINKNGVLLNWIFENGGTVTKGYIGTELIIEAELYNNLGLYVIRQYQAIDHKDLSDNAVNFLNLTFSILAATDTSINVVSIDDEPSLYTGTLNPTAYTEIGTYNGYAFDSLGADGGFINQVSLDNNVFEIKQDLYGYFSVVPPATLQNSVADYVLTDNVLSINTYRGETISVNLNTGQYEVVVTGNGLNVNEAPVPVIATTSGLLGTVDANVLGLIDLSKHQLFKVTDANDDLIEVNLTVTSELGSAVINALNISINNPLFNPAVPPSLVNPETLNLPLGSILNMATFGSLDVLIDFIGGGAQGLLNLLGLSYDLTYNTQLAAELGLEVTLSSPRFIQVGTQYVYGQTVSIKSVESGSTVSSQKMNELLGSIRMDYDGFAGVAGVNVAPTYLLAATDSASNTTIATSNNLLSLNVAQDLFGEDTDSFIIIDNGSNLNQSAATESVRIYGLAGDDTIKGGGCFRYSSWWCGE